MPLCMALPKKFDIKEIEAQVERRWETLSKQIKATTQYDPEKKMFSFLEGPPTANAPPALHHVEVRVFKDVYCRYKYMNGYTVPRKGGWDCHGLPVEVQVEKKLGLETKKAVVDYGVEKFCGECRTDIFTYIKDWEHMTRKMAYWVDLEKPYRTLDNTYIESVWWSLKEIHKKGLLYEGHKVVPYCPRCETPLSSHEVALGYKDVTESTVVVKMQDAEQPNRSYLAWTTTPWTLPANVCLAVNPDVKYAVVKEGDNEYVLAYDLVKEYFDSPNITDEFKGSTIIGRKYKPVFPYYADKEAFIIVGEDYVTTEDGTGIVHQAPAFGEIDYESVKKHGLPFINNVKANGHFDETVPDFQDKFVKEADADIIEWLDSHAKLYSTKKYTHSYPHCWRCSTPLLYYALNSWFIEVSKIRDRLVELNKEITWSPKHIQDGRFGNWLAGAKDWALSRFKFWGTPLPVWQCGCGEIKVIGSVEELEAQRVKEPGSAPLTLDSFDLHKSTCDNVKLKCDKCSEHMTRVPDVIDCWYDSGAAPFAQYHYPFENKELFDKSFPYAFISEAIDQTRGWFYTLHVLGTILFDSVAYKRCYVGGLLCDEHGDKMSKSKGNILKPNDLFDEYGVDAVRINMCSYPLGENVKFGRTNLEQKIIPFMRILWNSYGYAKTFFADHNYVKAIDKPSELSVEDNWILSRANTLIKTVEHALDAGEYSHAVANIQEFVENDLSRTYIKLIRPRARQKDDALAYTLWRVLDVTLKVIAPFAPYLSDVLYEHLWPTKQSVHFDSWPVAEEPNLALEESMNVIQELLSATNYARERAKRSVRWPIADAIVETDDPKVGRALELFSDMYKTQANIKSVNTVENMQGASNIVTINQSRLRKDCKQDSDHVLAHLDKENLEELYGKLERDGEYNVGEHKIVTDYFKVQHVDPDSYLSAPSRYGRVYLDTTVNKKLDAEGYAREIARRVQTMRKKAGMTKGQRIILHIQMVKEWDDLVSEHKDALKEQVGATSMIITSEPCTRKVHTIETAKIKELQITLSMAVEGLDKDFL